MRDDRRIRWRDVFAVEASLDIAKQTISRLDELCPINPRADGEIDGSFSHAREHYKRFRLLEAIGVSIACFAQQTHDARGILGISRADRHVDAACQKNGLY